MAQITNFIRQSIRFLARDVCVLLTFARAATLATSALAAVPPPVPGDPIPGDFVHSYAKLDQDPRGNPVRYPDGSPVCVQYIVVKDNITSINLAAFSVDERKDALAPGKFTPYVICPSDLTEGEPTEISFPIPGSGRRMFSAHQLVLKLHAINNE